MALVTIKLTGKNQLVQGNVDLTNHTVSIQEHLFNFGELNIDAPISGTIYGTLLNYQGNLEALGKQLYDKPYNEPPKAPILYIKPKNTIIGTNHDIPLPSDVTELEVGAALGIVIGKTAIRIKESDAQNYIKGYVIANDVSVPHEGYFRPAVKHKARDGFCPIGPWVIEQGSVKNPDSLSIRVYVNENLAQENTTSNLIRSTSRLLSDVTEFMTLYEGDVLLVGVPEGAPIVKANDVVRIEVEGIGSLENRVVAEHSLGRSELL